MTHLVISSICFGLMIAANIIQHVYINPEIITVIRLIVPFGSTIAASTTTIAPPIIV